MQCFSIIFCKAPLWEERIFRAPYLLPVSPLSIGFLYVYLFHGVLHASSSISSHPPWGNAGIVPNGRSPAKKFRTVPQPPARIKTPTYLFCAKIFQNMLETDILSKSSCLLAIFLCCLHSHDHRCLAYEDRVLYNSIVFKFKAFLQPPPLIATPQQLGTSE